MGNKGGIVYNQELFKDPGFRRALRFKIHGWGTANLTKILEASQKYPVIYKQRKDLFKEKIVEKKVLATQKLNEKKDFCKDKVLDLKNKLSKKED